MLVIPLKQKKPLQVHLGAAGSEGRCCCWWLVEWDRSCSLSLLNFSKIMNLCSLVHGYTVRSTFFPESCSPCCLMDFLSGYPQFSTAECYAEHIWAAGRSSLNLSPLQFQGGVHIPPVSSARFSPPQHLRSAFVAASLPVFQPLITP